MQRRPDQQRDTAASFRSADEYTGLLVVLTMILLSPLRLVAGPDAFRRLAWRVAAVVERLLMFGFLAVVVGLAAYLATGFDVLRWLGLALG